MSKRTAFALISSTILLAGCAGSGDNPLKVRRAVCPAAAILGGAGEVTLFTPPASRDASAIDVTGSMTALRSNCTDVKGSATITNQVTFVVVAQRRQTAGARDVTLPYFAAAVRAGDKLIAKQLGQVVLHFAAGQALAQAPGSARIDIARSATALPQDVNARLARKRKARDFDAGVDPLSEPTVRDAVRNASFELLVGFQLDDNSIAYNITK